MSFDISSSSIVELNLISSHKGIPMKFEKHPNCPTGSILQFGDKTYENISSSSKLSRSFVASQALEDYRKSSSSSDSSTTSLQAAISQLNELSQRLHKPINISYEINKRDNSNVFTCHISFLKYTSEAKALSKKKAREYASVKILDQINFDDTKRDNSPQNVALKNTSESNIDVFQDYQPRDYQEEIYNLGTTANIIICLGTGTGKTFISVLLIKKYSGATVGEYPNAKRIVFLVPTVALVHQQSEYIRRHTNLSVGQYSGNSTVNTWRVDKVINEIKNNQVLVMTAEIFRQLLQHNSICMKNISLLIFDECHHGINLGHSYNVIMSLYYHKDKSNQELPRIIGLTASPALNIDLSSQSNNLIIKNRIDSLEKIYNSKCITSVHYIESLNSFKSNPTIHVVLYNDAENYITSINNLADCLILFRSKFESFASKFISNRPLLQPIILSLEEEMDQKGTESSESLCVSICPLKMKKYCLKVFDNGSLICQELGIFGFYMFLKSVKSCLNQFISNQVYVHYAEMLIKLLKYLNRLEELLKKKIDDYLQSNQPLSITKISKSNLVSNKLSVLLNLLCQHYSTSNDSDGSFKVKPSTIIFTQKIITAAVLSSLLNEFSKLEAPNNVRIRFSSSYVAGVSNRHCLKNMTSGVLKLSLNIMKTRIECFHNNAFDMLVTTNVLEEGIDVKTCCVVIRFDRFCNLHSFIQSKGRIRRKDSAFYLFENETKALESKLKLNNFEKTEKIVKNILRNYCLEENNRPDAQDVLYPELPYDEQIYETAASRIDLRNAVSFLYRYCDASAKNQHSKPIFLKEMLNCKIRFELKLPDNVGIDNLYHSDWFYDEKIAKRHVSLRAIRDLHMKAYIDDNFLPTSHSSDMIIDLGANVSHLVKELHLSDNRQMNYYKISFPSSLTEKLSLDSFFVYTIIFSELNVCKSKQKYFGSFDVSEENIGLMLYQKIPKFSFPLASTFNSIEISIDLRDQAIQKFDLEELNIIHSFNKFIYEDLLKIVPKNCNWEPKNSHYSSFIILFDEERNIDYLKMKKVVQFLKEERPKRSCLTQDRDKRITGHDMCVIKNYSCDQTVYVVGGSFDVDVSSFIPDSEISFQEYYRNRWNIELPIDEIMLSCVANSRNINMLQKVSACQTRKSGCIHLPLSCVCIYPIDSSTLLKLNIMPSLIKRLTDFLNVYEWCANKFVVVGMDRIDAHEIDSFVHGDYLNVEKLISLQTISTDSVLEKFYKIIKNYWSWETEGEFMFKSFIQAFTRVSSNECCNYERMELLGDVFMKLIITLYLYIVFPNYSEGQLTSMRSKYVSNQTFFELGQILQIQGIMISKPTRFGKNWCPPGYQLQEEKFDGETNDVILHHYLPEKSIADVFESIIGCCLISSNVKTTFQFLNHLDLLPNQVDGFSIESFDELIQHLSIMNFEYSNVEEIKQDCEGIERAIGYSFKNINILAQAISHRSSLTLVGQESYERLEFLGDSIISFLISLYLYTSDQHYSHSPLSPYAITHIHHALVNNNMLGILAAKHGFVKSLQLKSYDLHVDISRFLKVVETLDNNDFIFEVPYLGLVCESLSIQSPQLSKSHTIEAISIPKVCADLFESIVGAVFIDSGCDFSLLAKIFMPLFKPYIEMYLRCFPIHPKIYIMENESDLSKNTTKLDGARYQTTLRCSYQDVDYVGIARSMEESNMVACYSLMKYQKIEQAKL